MQIVNLRPLRLSIRYGLMGLCPLLIMETIYCKCKTCREHHEEANAKTVIIGH